MQPKATPATHKPALQQLTGTKRNCLLIMFAGVLLAAGFGCRQPAAYRFQTFPVHELRADLKELYGKLDTVHYHLYHARSKAEFDSVYHSIYHSINRPLNAAEFYFRLLPLFHLLRDAHTMLGFPFSYSKAYSEQGGLFIPVRVFITGSKVYVSENLSPASFPLYSEIVSVNGVPCSQILNTLRLTINREQPESESDYMAHFFHRILYPVYGFDKTFTLQLLLPGGRVHQVTLQGIPLEEFPKENEPYFRSEYLNDSTLLIDINRCEGREEFAAFCDTVFESARKNKAGHLIIDLRNNPGGSTFHGDTLFTYLTKQKFTQYHKRSIKYSPYSTPASDSVYTETFSRNTELAHKNNKLFTSRVYMLINRNTFSSAAVMAATFSCYKMGLLIGQTTGGTQIFFDEPVEFKLYNSGLRFLVANQVNYCPCGTDWNTGINPHKPVALNLADKAKGTDTEMEYVKALISQSAKK